MSAFIELENVSKSYGSGPSAVHAVDGITFEAQRGEWIAIMGPSGSGKTTLLNLIGCLDQPTAGALRIDGTDTAQLRPGDLARFRSETVGFIFQQFHLVPHLNALENVMLAQYFHSMTDETEALAALKQVGMEGRASHLPSQLSGGEQQRVAIARALVNDPKIILADEPTGNLDAENQSIVFRILSDLHAQGRTIVMVTHDENAGRLAERRLNLEHGKIKENLLFSAEENQDFDEVLEHLWARQEIASGARAHDEVHIESHDFTAVQWKRLISTMSHIGLVEIEDGKERFTAKGHSRARDVIRRHRLAERLFMDVLNIHDEFEVEQSACKFEHILSPEVTDRMCALLGHPAACPHGSPIPPGECCVKQTVLEPSEIASVLAGVKGSPKSI